MTAKLVTPTGKSVTVKVVTPTGISLSVKLVTGKRSMAFKPNTSKLVTGKSVTVKLVRVNQWHSYLLQVNR